MTATRLFGAVFAYFLPLLIGLVILELIERGRKLFRFGEKLAYGFALGAGVIGFYLFYLGLAEVPFTFFAVTLIAWPWLIAAGLLIKKQGFRSLLPFPVLRRPNGWGWGKKLTGAIIGILLLWKLLFALFHIAFVPTYFDDETANYNYKPKVFYHTQSIVIDPDSPWFMGGYRPAYPQGIPLFKVWVMTLTGGWTEPAVNLLSPLAWIGIGLIGWRSFRDYLPPFPAMAFSYALLSLPLLVFHSAFDYIDIHLAFFLLAGATLLIRWIRQQERILLLSAGLILGVSFSVKEEMLPLTIAGIIFPLVLWHIINRAQFRKWLTDFSIFLIPLLLFNLPWMVVKRVYNLAAHPEARSFEFHIEAFDYLSHHLFQTGNYNIIWPVFLGGMVLCLPWIFKTDVGYLALAIVGTMGITLSLFIFTPFFEFLKIGTTINRAMLIQAPLMVYFLSLLYDKLTSSGDEKL